MHHLMQIKDNKHNLHNYTYKSLFIHYYIQINLNMHNMRNYSHSNYF